MIIRSYEYMIALRFLLKGKLQTVLIIFGIAAGVAVQFFLSALIGGLQINLIDKTVGTGAHILFLPADTVPRKLSDSEGDNNEIYSYKEQTLKENLEILSFQQYVNYLKNQSEVIAVSPVAGGQGFIEKGGSISSVTIKGISQKEGAVIYKLERNLKAGKIKLSGNNVLIGKSISDKFKILTGDSFYLSNNTGTGDFFTVSGIFDLGSQVSNNLVFLSLERAQSFFSYQGITSIEVQIQKIFDAESLAVKYRGEFSRVKIESWQERNRELLVALRSQSSSSDIIQFFVLFSISLGIASVLGIAAVQKSKQLGILKAMGVDDRGAAAIFLIQGLILGLIGAIIGISLGLLLGLMFTQFAGNASFDLEITTVKIISPVILALISSGIASIIPARSASKLSPIEVIRNG